jgi:hypothetical protein
VNTICVPFTDLLSRLEKCGWCVLIGPCRKECQGVNVDSIATAQKMRGCTYIKGSLEIQIRGGSEYQMLVHTPVLGVGKLTPMQYNSSCCGKKGEVSGNALGLYLEVVWCQGHHCHS